MSVERNEMNDNDWPNREKNRELAEFEQKLRIAMQHRDAPIGLKQRVLARARELDQERSLAHRGRVWMWQRVAASAVLAAVLGGFAVYQQHEKRVEEQRKGEEAKEQVLTAFRITSKTLGRVNERLTV